MMRWLQRIHCKILFHILKPYKIPNRFVVWIRYSMFISTVRIQVEMEVRAVLYSTYRL